MLFKSASLFCPFCNCKATATTLAAAPAIALNAALSRGRRIARERRYHMSRRRATGSTPGYAHRGSSFCPLYDYNTAATAYIDTLSQKKRRGNV
ncbi:hypothetical protein K458DRAFT_2342 [Lentithecium fluviatile CBS 122367]|uniref:Uncharacterized protein n=1 Tax=Lentithecium fluviatile CBS 122367 TaxID=1168545 RepID=A0A6G1JM52_9PLEO|nr:hypothetical protein K458DRAFT_2342 [Lentithecium fluviatile CBS 122367]